MADDAERGAKRLKARAPVGSLADRLSNHSGTTKGPAEPRLIFNPRELLDFIEAMVGEGGACMFGATSDGGVLTVTTYLGKDRTVHYIGLREEWQRLLAVVLGTDDPSQLEGGKGASV